MNVLEISASGRRHDSVSRMLTAQLIDALEIRDGDIWVNGRVATKPVEVQRQVRIPVFDSRFRPRSPQHAERIRFSSGWNLTGNPWSFQAVLDTGDLKSELEYVHFRSCTTAHRLPLPVEDYYAYGVPSIGCGFIDGGIYQTAPFCARY